MKSERDVLSKFADEIAERIAHKVIAALQKVTDKLSGDDSELANAWDEICVQVQYERSFFWEAYDETVRSFVAGFVDELKPNEKAALWFQTEPGGDWLDDEEKTNEHPPIMDCELVDLLVHEHIYSEAANWANDRIRAYLDRH